MQEYIKQSQPIFYQTLQNSIQKNRIPHAYLLISQKGVNTSSIATFIAQSIMCKVSDVACETCETCCKIKDNNHIDSIRVDGRQESIKKKDIEEIQKRFTTSAIEGNARVYILEYIDNATVESMNSLLKMLEEPTDGIYAIFTCDNIERVLPTIISRCQVIHFKAINQQKMLDDLLLHNIKKEDAMILSQIYESNDKILEIVDSQEYFTLKVEAINFLSDYFFKKENLMINTQTHVMRQFKEKKDIDLFLDLTIFAFLDVVHKYYELPLLYESKTELITSCVGSLDDTIHVIELLLQTKEKIKGNSNIPLAMDYLIYHM